MSIWGALFLTGIVLWFGSGLPDIDGLMELSRRPSIEIFDIHDNPIASYGDLYGKPIAAEDLPPHIIQALLAIEDRRFYEHMGVDPVGIARAFYVNLKAGYVVQGGSTITQQLAKNFLQSKKIYGYRDRSLHRKISELLLSIQIERRFTKNQILTMHLNRVYMGSGTWGIDAAALKYFGRNAQELNLYEAALLMGLLQAPSLYSPARNQARSEIRAQKVLDAMVHAGFIQEEEAVAAMAMPSGLAYTARQDSGRYFADWVMDQLQEVVDTQSQDLIVKTTLNLPVQRIAERQAHRVMQAYGKPRKAEQMALVSMDATGAVQAMVGGMDYKTSSYNRATQALRQSGSAFKYFVYLAALEQGYSPESRINDRPITLGKWTAQNFRYISSGSISLRNAFAKSVNAVAIRLAINIGIPRIIRMARKMGIESPIADQAKNYTLALGTSGVNLLELTGAFAVILNQGYPVKPYGIVTIHNRKKECLYKHVPENVDEPILEAEVVNDMKVLLREVFRSGTGRLAAFGSMPLMGKSGTSNKGKLDRDLWFMGITPHYVTGVWTGCDDEKGMLPLKNGSPSLHLWKNFNIVMAQYHKDPENPNWENPDGHPDELKWASLGKPGGHMSSNLKEDIIQPVEEEDDDDDDDDDDDETDDQPKNRDTDQSGTPGNRNASHQNVGNGRSNRNADRIAGNHLGHKDDSEDDYNAPTVKTPYQNSQPANPSSREDDDDDSTSEDDDDEDAAYG